ncbi:MAG: FecR domain-containing protein [Pseudomonadota bacterium]
MLKSVFLAATLIVTLVFSPGPVLAADEIGAATKIVRNVTGRLAGRSARLARGDTVFQDQRVRAGSASFGQFQLSDGSRLAINANSALTLDRAVFSGSSGSLVLKAARGALRFATGRLPSRAYKIVTPSSTIGVRGTMFDVYVGARRQTIVTLLYGEVQACNRRGQCRTLRQRCESVRINPDGSFVQADRPNRRVLGGEPARRAIPFLVSQRRLSRSLTIPGYAAARCASASVNFEDVWTGGEDSDDGASDNGRDVQGGGGFGSDIRLKRDVVRLEKLGNGLSLYRFRYLWSDQTYIGVMAQDVLKLYPEAVSRGPGGYYRVDYRMLGLEMMTLAEWNKRNSATRLGWR